MPNELRDAVNQEVVVVVVPGRAHHIHRIVYRHVTVTTRLPVRANRRGLRILSKREEMHDYIIYCTNQFLYMIVLY